MKQKGVHVIPIEDLVPNCFHAVVSTLEEIRDKVKHEITGPETQRKLDELWKTANDLILEIKDANFDINYLHIALIEAFANLLEKASLGPYKLRLNRAVEPAYAYVRTRQRQPE